MIRWTILTDTSNLSTVTKKATDEDVRVLEDLERRLDISADSRTGDYNLISLAKADTSHFDCSMLIRNDEMRNAIILLNLTRFEMTISKSECCNFC